MSKDCSNCIHYEVCIARHKAGHNNTCYTDCGGYCTEFIDKDNIANVLSNQMVIHNKVENAISIMKKAYGTYCTMARQNLEKDLTEDYWHWRGIAEGTRRSWELLEELFNLKDEDEDEEANIECDGRCLNCDDYGTSACPDRY